MSAKVTVTICEEEIQQFCKQLIQRSRDITKTHESLITIEALLGCMSHSADSPKAYESIMSTVKQYSKETRAVLMQQYADNLASALQRRDEKLIREVYVRLSRNGFYQILQQVVDELSEEQSLTANSWCLKWLTAAKRDAEKASGFPDAYDFKKAGVDLELYYALDDISRYLLRR